MLILPFALAKRLLFAIFLSVFLLVYLLPLSHARPVPCNDTTQQPPPPGQQEPGQHQQPVLFGYDNWSTLRRALEEEQESGLVTLCPGAIFEVDRAISITHSNVVITCGHYHDTSKNNNKNNDPVQEPCLVQNGRSHHFVITTNDATNTTTNNNNNNTTTTTPPSVPPTNITFQGLTLQQSTLSSIRILVAGQVTFRHCTWRDNRVPVTTPGGAALEIVATATTTHNNDDDNNNDNDGVVRLDHCTLRHNGGGLHGAVRIRRGRLVVDTCTFDNNTAVQDILGGWAEPTWTRGAALTVGQYATFSPNMVLTNAAHATVQHSCFVRHTQGYGTIFVAQGSTLNVTGNSSHNHDTTTNNNNTNNNNNFGHDNAMQVQGFVDVDETDLACSDIVWMQTTIHNETNATRTTTTCQAFPAERCAVPSTLGACATDPNVTGYDTAFELKAALEWRQESSVTLCPHTTFLLKAQPPLEIVQPGTTITCGATGQSDNACLLQATLGHFVITTTNVTLQGLTLQGTMDASSVVVETETTGIVLFQDVVWRRNNARQGAAIYATTDGVSLVLEQCRLVDNTRGGAIFIQKDASITLESCLFAGNEASLPNLGGALTLTDGQAYIQNCCFVDNTGDATVHATNGTIPIVVESLGLNNTLTADATHNCANVWLAATEECLPFDGNNLTQCLDIPPTPSPTISPTNGPTTTFPTTVPTFVNTSAPTTLPWSTTTTTTSPTANLVRSNEPSGRPSLSNASTTSRPTTVNPTPPNPTVRTLAPSTTIAPSMLPAALPPTSPDPTSSSTVPPTLSLWILPLFLLFLTTMANVLCV